MGIFVLPSVLHSIHCDALAHAGAQVLTLAVCDDAGQRLLQASLKAVCASALSK
jgi:hypothetical protein